MELLLEIQKCRSWEEDFYWKHLKSVHFFRILPDDFHERLVLPQKFAGNMLLDLPNKVPLFGPSGAKWDVTLTKTNNIAIVGDGWKEFVKSHALEATYLLMFKYRRNEGFDVLIFDPETTCEKEFGYFVKNNDKPTINSNNDDEQKKRSSAEAFGTATEVLEDDDNFDDSEFVTSKRIGEDPLWTGETNNKQTPQKWSSGRGKQGGRQGRGRGCGRGRRISASHLKAGSVEFGTPKRNKAGKEQPVVENRESNLGLGRSQELSEIRGAEEHIRAESGEGNLEIVQSPKPNEIKGLQVGTSNRNQTDEEQPLVENRERCLELGCSHVSSEIRGKKTNGSEPVKKLNSPENEESILQMVHRLRCYETRGKKAKEFEAAKEQHGIGHSPMSIKVIGNAPYGLMVSKEQSCALIEGTTPEMHACKSSRARGRPRKQSAPRKNYLVNENVLSGDKSNTIEATKEQNGIDTRASALEMEMDGSDKTVKTRGHRRKANHS